MSRGALWRITWGTAYANTFDGAYPLDVAVAWSQDRAGSATVQTLAGVEDAWIVGTDHLLSGQVRWLTTAQWDGATGFRALLEWARAKNVVRWYGNRVGAPSTYTPCYLVEASAPELEPDGTRKVTVTLRSSDGSAFTGY